MRYLFLSVLFLSSFLAKAQEEFSMLINPELIFNFENSSPWAYQFSVVNRDLIYQQDYQFRKRNIELYHFTHYNINSHRISLGGHYRIREAFVESNEDEKRIAEQYRYNYVYQNKLKIINVILLEQRFREIFTFRTRYNLLIGIPLDGKKADDSRFFLNIHSESLWSIGKESIPDFEQRFALALKKDVFNSIKIHLEFEYRHRDYTHNPYGELMIFAGATFSL